MITPGSPADLRHRRFAAEYVIDFNRTAAAIRAGYSQRTAHSIGSRLFKDPTVQQYIKEEQEARSKRVHVDADRVLRELARIAFFDPRKLLKPDGSPKQMNHLDDDTAAAISGLDVLEVYEGSGAERTFVGYVKKYRISDKNAALTNCLKHLGLLKETMALTGPDGGPVELNVTAAASKALTETLKEKLRDRTKQAKG
jgi:phage terminase small subunit